MTGTIDTLTAPEIFTDGIHEIKIIEGVVRIAMYSRQDSTRTVVVRMIIPVTELPDVIQALVQTMADATKPLIRPLVGATAH